MNVSKICPALILSAVIALLYLQIRNLRDVVWQALVLPHQMRMKMGN